MQADKISIKSSTKEPLILYPQGGRQSSLSTILLFLFKVNKNTTVKNEYYKKNNGIVFSNCNLLLQ
jgi:hypothetical protein